MSKVVFSNLKEWKQRALRMHFQGLTSSEISTELGISDRTIRDNIQKLAHRVDKSVALKMRKPTIFVIGDTQVKQGISLDYIHWIANYIKLKQPDIIVQIGDHYDMASLSTYDKGQLSAEGRRFVLDIEAGDEALGIIEDYIRSVKGYNPRKVVVLGNHEDRIDRFVKTHPEFEGLIGTDKLAFHDYGWEVIPFLKPHNICGIHFVHYVINVNTGKPLGGNLDLRLKTVGESFVMGHQQMYAYAERQLPMTGRKQFAAVVGACYVHDEPYKGWQGNHHFRGCLMLYGCADGYAMQKKVELEHMREIYEGEHA
ncbi:putative phosphoestherase [Acinetobacter virus fBenAci003]|uniref:Metallo-phosphoesterase n=5 Tax=Viruses TaxID=10239 RepID=A0AAU8KV79_9VIRU|nr:putative phosphoestherase [Acinetobacter virus fBenAci001]QOV07833.1 putative phosphoestherase [Acinetobacter virus fBenAci003]